MLINDLRTVQARLFIVYFRLKWRGIIAVYAMLNAFLWNKIH